MDQLQDMMCDGTNKPLLSLWNKTLCKAKPFINLPRPQDRHLALAVPSYFSSSFSNNVPNVFNLVVALWLFLLF